MGGMGARLTPLGAADNKRECPPSEVEAAETTARTVCDQTETDKDEQAGEATELNRLLSKIPNSPPRPLSNSKAKANGNANASCM